MRFAFLSLMLLSFLFSCKRETTSYIEEVQPEKTISKEESIEMHRFWIKDESYKIDQYIKRHGWDATTTESGLRYFIYERGEGVKVEKDMLITLDFEVRLIDADTTLCYSSKDNGPQSFLMERDNVESGLHEAVKYLHVGDKAYVILPHYAAHGLIGDMNKIPPLSSVLYNIHVLDAKF